MEEQSIQENKLTPEDQTLIIPNVEPKKKRIWLKIIIWFFSILFLLVILLFSTPYILSFLWGKDSPPPNDQDIMLQSVNIPKEKNGYFDLIKLSDINGGETKKAEIKIIIPKDINDMEYLESNRWNNNIIENLLASNTEALKIFSDAANKPEFQIDTTANPVNIQPNMPVVALNTWRQISRISAIKAIFLMRQGKDVEAFDEVMKIIKIGSDIEKSKNIYLIAYLVGISIKQTGLDTMRVLIDRSSSSSEILNSYHKKIKEYESVNNIDPFRMEYKLGKMGLENLDISEYDYPINYLYNIKFYFKLNQTLELYANYYRQVIENFEKPCTEKWIINKNEPDMSWKIYITENSIGKMLISLGVVALENLRNKKCNSDLTLNVTDILFALKRYQIEKNGYPDNLADLAPNYINELPVDPYSGKPFIYYKNKKTFYSIGKDYKDNGGSTLDKSWQSMDDPTFSFDFTNIQLQNIPDASSTNATSSETISSSTPKIDGDNDGLSDVEETAYGTDPKNPDTDGDGFLDGAEVEKGFNPNGSGKLTK